MKTSQLKLPALALMLVVLISGCNLLEVDTVVDPNNPSSEAILSGATRGELQDVVTGLESAHRNYNNASSDWWSLVGSFGRELYYINTSDPNFASAWLQYPEAQNAEEDNNFFVDASAYEAPYFAVRQANLLIEASSNTEAISSAERSGYVGFAKTIKAYQLLVPLHTQYQNGIRIDLPYTDPLNPGPFLSYSEALAQIRALLDEAASDLGNAGNSFAFTLSDGFNGFDTPATMLALNRAIAARAALYAEDWDGAITSVNNSFLDLSAGEASMMIGPAHTFAGGQDIFNPYFFVPDANPNLLIVPNPDLINDAEAGDERIDNKFQLRSSPATTPDIPALSADYQDARYATPTSQIPFIRNEELILIYAEAKAQREQGTDLTDAVDAINLIRSTWGLSPFSSVSQSDIIDQVLFERRYSLYGEGHRWVDMRRYNRLSELDTSIDGGRVPTNIARPQGEIDWENFTDN